MGWQELHSMWIELGGDPERFWHLTPAVVSRETKALVSKRKEAYRLAAWQSWHTALWQRIDHRKFPKLQDVMAVGQAKPRTVQKQSQDVILANMKAVFLMFGGDPETLRTLQ